MLAALNGTAAAPMVSALSGAASMVTPQMMQTLMEGLMQGAAARSSARARLALLNVHSSCCSADHACLIAWHVCAGMSALSRNAQGSG